MGLPPAPVTTLSLTDAITAFDSAQATLANADSAQTVAKGQVDAAQAKLQAAQDAKTATDTADTQAVAAFNQSIDDLIAAATAAKR